MDWLELIHGATTDALEKTEIVTKTIGFKSIIEVSYKDVEKIKYELEKHNIKISKIEYKENVEISIELPQNKKEILEKMNIKTQNSTKKYVEI